MCVPASRSSLSSHRGSSGPQCDGSHFRPHGVAAAVRGCALGRLCNAQRRDCQSQCHRRTKCARVCMRAAIKREGRIGRIRWPRTLQGPDHGLVAAVPLAGRRGIRVARARHARGHTVPSEEATCLLRRRIRLCGWRRRDRAACRGHSAAPFLRAKSVACCPCSTAAPRHTRSLSRMSPARPATYGLRSARQGTCGYLPATALALSARHGTCGYQCARPPGQGIVLVAVVLVPSKNVKSARNGNPPRGQRLGRTKPFGEYGRYLPCRCS
jgi:hypothetical protein